MAGSADRDDLTQHSSRRKRGLTHEIPQAFDARETVVREVELFEVDERVESFDLGQAIAWQSGPLKISSPLPNRTELS